METFKITRCEVCQKKINGSVCVVCEKNCEVVMLPDGGGLSHCCGAAILLRQTCGRDCHEVFIQNVERRYGKYKVIQDLETGRRYSVPVRRIIEKGIRYSELHEFPEV